VAISGGGKAGQRAESAESGFLTGGDGLYRGRPMREIATFEDERTAKRLADVLSVRDIDAEISRGRSGSYSVWVLEEGKVEAARAAWAAVDSNPDSPEVRAAAGAFDRKQKEAQARARDSRHEVIDLRTSLRVGGVRPVRVVPVLLALCLAGALLTRLGDRLDVMVWVYIGLPGEPHFARVLGGEVWRVITPIFVHMGVLHLVFNMWWLVDLGAAIERRIGSGRFLLLVLVTGVLSNSAQYLVKGPLFAGMSGVVYALLGYAFVRGKMDALFGLELPQSAVVVLLAWLVLGFTAMIPGMANYAHLGGLVSGMVLGVRLRRR